MYENFMIIARSESGPNVVEYYSRYFIWISHGAVLHQAKCKKYIEEERFWHKYSKMLSFQVRLKYSTLTRELKSNKTLKFCA